MVFGIRQSRSTAESILVLAIRFCLQYQINFQTVSDLRQEMKRLLISGGEQRN